MSDPKTESETDIAPTLVEEKEPSLENQFTYAKTNYFIIKNAIDHREEPLETMEELSRFIQKVVEDPQIFGENKEFKNFFYQDLTLGLLKRMNKERSADPQYLEVIAKLMKQFFVLFTKDIENVDLAEAMRYAFDYNCILHTYHYEDEESEIRLREQKKAEKWRNELKIGDRIDAIKGDEKCKCWGVAIVSAIHDEVIDIEFERDSKFYDKAINKYSSDIAPLGEYSVEQEWKSELKKGDEIDGFDKAKVWYASTILDFKVHVEPDRRSWELVQMGFRLYTPDGSKTDDEGKKFDGWSSRFDEWVPLWSPKIAKLHSHTKPKGGKGARFSEDTIIDDANDPQVKEGDEPIYAVVRPRKCKSYLLVECMNIFGRLGGFDKILEKMSNKDDPIDFTLLSHYMDSIGKVFPMYHRDFIIKFAEDVKNAVQTSILNAPEASIRNVRREKIEGIVSKLNDILRRVYGYEVRDREIEHLNLDIVLM